MDTYIYIYLFMFVCLFKPQVGLIMKLPLSSIANSMIIKANIHFTVSAAVGHHSSFSENAIMEEFDVKNSTESPVLHNKVEQN